MDEYSRGLTTFLTRSGTYQLQVMPFELTKAPSTSQRKVDEVLQDFLFAGVYLDEMVIFSQHMEKHIQ